VPRSSAVTPDHFTTFGDLLKFLRRRAGLTQRDLSIAVGYSESQISRLEQNQRPPDEASLAARFVPALHLESEREWAARLLELAAASRDAGEPATQGEGDTPAPPDNLPVQLTSFVGREKELAEIKRLITPLRGAQAAARPVSAGAVDEVQVRLVTLTGPGGTGKTRLALRAAANLLNVFPDGVWLVELAPLADPELIPQTVAALFALKEEANRPLLATLIDYLRGKTALLILDNCEHLIQASAQLAEALLRACPDLRILASSREMLGVAGERSFYVPSLSIPDPRITISVETLKSFEAAQLFAARAIAVAPGFALTNANAPAVAQVCQRLDGIPLAIELAAARVKVLRVEQIAARLNDRFRLLTGGSRTALPRHQTLQALIDWSHDLLSESERVLLQRLSVFMGGWTLEAAEAVGSDRDEGTRMTVRPTTGTPGSRTGKDVLDLLTQLTSKSLVVTEREPGADARYRMLETIRQYALAKLAASGEADDVRKRHATYYLALAEAGLSSYPGQSAAPAWLDRMAIEHDNLRAALTWAQSAVGDAELGLRLAGAIGRFWAGGGYWIEASNWLKGALEHADAEGVEYAPARARVHQALGDFLALQGVYTAGRAQMAASLKLVQDSGDLPFYAYVVGRLGWLAREQGDAVNARLRLEESLAIRRDLGDAVGIAWALVTLGEVAVLQEEPARATSLLEESQTLFRAQEITEGIAWALNHLGHVAQILGKYDEATRFHNKSLPLFRESGRQNLGDLGPAWAFQGLGETALAQGNAILAMTHLTNALVLFRDLGDRAGMAWCLAGLAGVTVVNEDPERAAWLYGAAEGLRQAIGARQAPAARATRERLMAAAREQLGDVAFDAEWAEGQAMTLEQAIAYALDEGELLVRRVDPHARP
jgi:predicted ATPase